MKKYSATWLIYWRTKRSLTQKELAEMVSTTYQQIQRWETIAGSIPSANNAMMLAEALRIDINELYDH